MVYFKISYDEFADTIYVYITINSEYLEKVFYIHERLFERYKKIVTSGTGGYINYGIKLYSYQDIDQELGHIERLINIVTSMDVNIIKVLLQISSTNRYIRSF